MAKPEPENTLPASLRQDELEQLLHLDDLTEKLTFEVKRATGKDGTGKIPDDFYPTYSAFANAIGGTIVLGLEEIHSKTTSFRYKLRGIPNPQEIIDRLFSTLHNQNKVSKNLITPDLIETISVRGTYLIKITVPKAEREDKPIFINGNPLNGTYMRNGSGDYLCKHEDVLFMFREASPTVTPDSKILPEYTIHDLNPRSVLAYRQLFRSTKQNHDWNILSDEEFLRRIKAINTDREKKIEGVTLAGLIMFGTQHEITNHLSNYHLDYLEISSPDPDNRYDHKFSSDSGTWSGNLFDFFLEVDKRLAQNMNIPFRLNGRQRIDESPASVALREALVNTLIHADYFCPAPIKIQKYPDKFIFINPGDMRRPLEYAKDGGISDCRNRILQSMFSHIGYGDHEGFGIVKIYQIWEQQNGGVVKYQIDKSPLRTTLTMQVYRFPHEIYLKLQNRFGLVLDTFSEDQINALALIELYGTVTHKQIMEFTSSHTRDVTLALSKLANKGIICGDKQRPTTYTYTLLYRDNPNALICEKPDTKQTTLLTVESLYRTKESEPLNTDHGKNPVISELSNTSQGKNPVISELSNTSQGKNPVISELSNTSQGKNKYQSRQKPSYK